MANVFFAILIGLVCWGLCVFFAYGGIVKRRLFLRLMRNLGRWRFCWLLLGLAIAAGAALGFWRCQAYFVLGTFLPYLQFMLLFAYLLAMTLTDLRRHEICADCSIFFALLWLMIITMFGWRYGDFETLLYALGGGLLGLGLPLLIYFVRRDAIGLGDAMLLGCCGIYCGFYGILQLVFKAMVLGMLLSLILLLVKKVNLKTQLPFAPFVLAAWLI